VGVIAALGLATFLVFLSASLTAHMQDPTEGELRRLSESYAQAWAKGDAKAVAALYSSEAIRIGPDGKISVGRAAIEQALTEALQASYRGTKISLTHGQTKRASQDAYVSEGTFLIGGGMPAPGAPTRGRFLQTLVRVSGRWMIAGDAAISPPRPAK
jgi:uncharacterized protein (TIGR02246 family)